MSSNTRKFHSSLRTIDTLVSEIYLFFFSLFLQMVIHKLSFFLNFFFFFVRSSKHQLFFLFFFFSSPRPRHLPPPTPQWWLTHIFITIRYLHVKDVYSMLRYSGIILCRKDDRVTSSELLVRAQVENTLDADYPFLHGIIACRAR